MSAEADTLERQLDEETRDTERRRLIALAMRPADWRKVIAALRRLELIEKCEK